MRQMLFVLRKGEIACWEFSRGKLAKRTFNGNVWNPYQSSFWADWSKVNQPSESEDAIGLSDEASNFGKLPSWLKAREMASAWTVENLAKLAKDAEFKGKAIVLRQGETKLTLSKGSTQECYEVNSSYKFNLPKETPKPKPQPVPKKPAVIGDSCNDPKALKLSIGNKVTGRVEAILKTLNRYYIKADGLTDQVCFKPDSKQTFSIGDKVTLCMTSIDKIEKKVFFSITKN